MKQRIATVMAGIVAVIFITGTAMADEHGQGMQHGKMMQDKQDMPEKKGMMQNKQDMSGKKKGMMKDMMQGGMMGGMMKRQVVATSDGGVVVVAGDMLLKYDKDLELVKKTTLEISDEDMQQMMKKMQKHRGMCMKMCKQKMADKKDAKAADEAEEANE